VFETIIETCNKLEKEFDLITAERKKKLRELSAYIAETYQQKVTPKLIVICTHNSRRSHLGQIWLSLAAAYYQLPSIETYSGGTAATAFYKSGVEALRKIGLQIEAPPTSTSNPIYSISWNEKMKPYHAFSKVFSESPNPTQDFGAILVCNSASEACPIVHGADFRIAIPYVDPKAFDNTELESQKYEERCLQIGREFLYTFSLIKT